MKREESPYPERASKNFIATRNACKLCAPLGAGIVFRGIENCVPLVHGSQGCSTYIRRYVISHFREPVDIASSNFSEASAIFGGEENLKTALDNITRQYQPEAIGIATTCLSETIGDDIGLYLSRYRKERRGTDLPVLIHAPTPSYRGTHMDGFHEAVRATLETLAEGGFRNNSINLIPGFLSAGDLRHLKEILADFRTRFTLLPDFSETLDGEAWSEYRKLAPGGTPLCSIRAMGRASGTIQFGKSISEQKSGAALLHDRFGVPERSTGIPIGIRESDRFFQVLRELTGIEEPEKYRRERFRLVDSYIDGHKYVFGKRAVLYGEPDLVASMASFCDEIGMVPVLCATGARPGSFRETILEGLENNRAGIHVLEDGDFVTILEKAGELGADIVIGNSKGYFLSRKLGIPIVRAGFPIHDRIGGQRLLHIGYRGTQQLFDRVVNALLEFRQEGSSVGYSYM